jgi:phosphatidylserine/phosphatidylglycerophosphate/cardiolipin synthase-like enzyme
MQKESHNGFTAVSYVGDSAVLLAFDVDRKKIDMGRLAGFTILCQTPKAGPYPTNRYFLPNKMGFAVPATASEGSQPDLGSDKAPFQTFHWIHMPGAGPGRYRYTIFVRYFGSTNPSEIEWGPQVTLKVDLRYHVFDRIEVGFTRGYVSAQAFADRFSNDNLRPEPRTVDYDTKPYRKAYEWLGAHARRCVTRFLEGATRWWWPRQIDVFAYDLDDPEIIKALCKAGKRARVFLDDYSNGSADDDPGHGPGSLEDAAATLLARAHVQVRRGHFSRFSHDKVFILKKKSIFKKGVEPYRVLTGSANFSIRGLCVQSNNVLVFKNRSTAQAYGHVFEEVWNNTGRLHDSGDVAAAFRKNPISQDWHVIETKHLGLAPKVFAAFSPHKKAKDKGDSPFTLDTIADAVKRADRAVLFAIMQSGGGSVYEALNEATSNPDIYCLGVTQAQKGFNAARGDIDAEDGFGSFSEIYQAVPPPFKDEWNGGQGIVIHHKFVVVDFNGRDPVVFCGSSNLAKGGEEENGDNLLAIHDADIATCYTIEAIRIFDYYRFKIKQAHLGKGKKMALDPTANWVRPNFEEGSFKHHEREVLTGQRIKKSKKIPVTPLVH